MSGNGQPIVGGPVRAGVRFNPGAGEEWRPRYYSLKRKFGNLIIATGLLAGYLGTGAAWKMVQLLRYPGTAPLVGAIRGALRPYSIVPVGYALGTRFGTLAQALRLTSTTSETPPAGVRAAADTLRGLASSHSSWSDVAAFEVATLERQPERLAPSREGDQVLIMMLDDQRWGRTTASRSGLTEASKAHYRQIAQDYPDSPVASDALLALAEIERADWEFRDARVCQVTAAMIRPDRASNLSDTASTLTDDPKIAALSGAYALYLRAAPAERSALRDPLFQLAVKGDDPVLAQWVSVEGSDPGKAGRYDEWTGAGNAGAPSATNKTFPGGHSVRLTAAGGAVTGAHIALLQMDRLEMAMQAGQMRLSRPSIPGAPQPQETARTVEALNPARTDDPFRAGGLALISLPMAGYFARELPVAATGPGGYARFTAAKNPALGVALLINRPAGAPDECLVPSADPIASGGVKLVPRVQVLPSRVTRGGPPLLRWKRYPGAASYLAAVSLQPVPTSGSPSTALSPEWDRRVLWWREGIRSNSVTMGPDGFVGPAADIRGNGLWVGWIYRVLVVALNAGGQPIATSIGLKDHRDEFFTPIANWLGLDTPGAQVPAVGDAVGVELERKMSRPFRRRRGAYQRRGAGQPPEPGPRPPERRITNAPDLLEQVMEISRALAPPTLPGAGNFEAALKPVPAHSSGAVQLAPWAASNSPGQGRIPLRAPVSMPFMFPGAAALPLSP